MLIDTNIIVEIGKAQEKSEDCRDLISLIYKNFIKEDVYLTEFGLNAIQAMLSKVDRGLVKEILLLVHDGKIKLVKMDNTDNLMILSILEQLGLDFDDALHFVAANKKGTYLVTYDKDFENTGLQIKTPAQVLEKILI